MSEVEGQTLALKHGEITFGIQVIKQDGAPPIINLFELNEAENSGLNLAQNIFEAVPEIKQRYFPDLDITNINWTITNGLRHSPIEFKEIDGHLVQTTFTRGFTGDRPMGNIFSLEAYAEAARNPNGLEYAMTHDLPTASWMNSGGSSDTFLAIPAPNHPDGVYYMRTNSNTSHEVVFVDTDRFMNDFRRSDPEINTLNSDPTAVLEHMWGEKPSEIGGHSLAEVNYLNGEIRFTNGRHRTANLAALDAPYLPIEVDMNYESGHQLRALYEYGRPPQVTFNNVDVRTILILRE